MHCPKCGIENPDNAKVCNSCNCVLISTSTSAPNPDTKTSGLAIASFVLGILSVSILTAIPAIILGIISLVKISKSAGQLKGKVFAILGIIIPSVCLLLLLLLITPLIPALSTVNKYAIEVKQMAQFSSIELALVVFRNDFGDYPPSDATNPSGQAYCGAMKLCEAIWGHDLNGFHPDSQFKQDGTNNSGHSLYVPTTLDTRRGPYLEPFNANVYRLKDVFDDVGPFDGESFVICDVYAKKRHSGKKTGMPILYYKANIFRKTMAPPEPMKERIYNAQDNLTLIRLARTRDSEIHPLGNADGEFFYDEDYGIIDQKITARVWPHRADSFILLSAGPDGLYGTEDDIANFEMR
jgi:hypothetical protein